MSQLPEVEATMALIREVNERHGKIEQRLDNLERVTADHWRVINVIEKRLAPISDARIFLSVLNAPMGVAAIAWGCVTDNYWVGLACVVVGTMLVAANAASSLWVRRQL